MKANYRGRNATVKKDEWGFTMANFNALVPHGYESFAFPIHCEHVFFSDDEDEPGWRVVLRTEVRGCRIDRVVYRDVMTVSCRHVVSCRDGPLRHDTIGST